MAATGHRDDVGAEEDSVEDGAGGGHIAEEFAPVFDWGGGHEGRAGIVAAESRRFCEDRQCVWQARLAL